jgi:hypothetical protein
MTNRMAALAAAVVFLSAGAARADIMPNLANVPAGWSVDRYAPQSFSNVGTYQGRDNVLGIQITSAGDLANRPAAYQYTFYNTQGMGHAVTGGAGTELDADLYIPLSWGDPATNGSVRTDMWGVMVDSTSSVTDYPIIGFTNYGGAPRFRVWDENLNGGAGAWIDLATPVTYDAWTAFAIKYDGANMDFFINGNQVAGYAEDSTTTGFSQVLMQAYNFADPSISGANPQDFTANWANTPEPSSYFLLFTVVAGLGVMRRKIQQRGSEPRP